MTDETDAALQRKFDLLNSSLRAVPEPPRLYTLNGSGGQFVGKIEDPDISPKFFGLYSRTFAHMPTGGQRIFLLSHPVKPNGQPDLGAYLFHGEISEDDFVKVYPQGLGDMKSGAWMKFLIAASIAVVIAIVVAVAKHR